MALIKKYDVEPTDVHEMFLSANHRTLIEVGLAATLIAFLLCLWLTRRILAPIEQMLKSTRRIAEGDYECVTPAATRDELGELATAFARMAESLARNDRLRKNMIVDVAHELRTPLTNIRGYIEALQDRLVEADDEVLGNLHAELLRLVRLTENLLSSARREARELSVHKVDAVGLVSESVELFRPRFEERRIEIRTSLPERPVQIQANGDQMRQVLGNLLENCLHFSPDGSWTEIRVTRSDDHVRFTFRNPGDGIDTEDLPWIFEHYYRADKSRSRDTGGAGIGLAIVKMIVEGHHGDVGAQSDPDCTSIWFDLPGAPGASSR